jgi:small-conductance mechanosensitive channel
MFQAIKSAFGPAGEYVLVGGLFLAAVVAGLVLQFLFLALVRALAEKSGSASGRLVARHLRWPLRLGGPLLLVDVLYSFLRSPAVPEDARFSDAAAVPIDHVLLSMFIFVLAWLAVKINSFAVEIVERRLEKAQAGSLRTRKIATQIRIIKRIVSVVIIFIAAAVFLLQFQAISSLGATLLASAGVLGIIFGFAAQRSLSTLFAGFQIAFTQPIRLDDVVVVEGEWGRIEEITLTYVVVRIWDLRRLILPVTYFLEKSFQNWTRSSAAVMGTVYLYADYTAPVATIRDKLKEIVSADPLWDRQVCVLQMTDARDRTVELRALVSAADSGALWDLRCRVREELVRFLAESYPLALPKVRATLEREEDPRQPPLPS